jgi:hypothetical protein
MAQLASVLIIAPPGRLRDSLCVLLHASAAIERIELDDGAAAPPDLIVLDAEALEDHTWPAALLDLQRRWPECACLVVTHTAGQEHRAREAGACHVLSPGFSTQDLGQMIDTLKTPPGFASRAANEKEPLL